MLAKIASKFKATLSQVKVDGNWREVDVGWVKNGTTWNRFKYPYVARDIIFRVGTADGKNADGTTYNRRSALRSGNGPAVGGTPGSFYQGSCAQSAFVINGVTVQLRGIEMGSDTIGGQPSWKWVSVQFFGNVDVKYLARVLRYNGLPGYNLDVSYNSQVDITFMTFALPDGVQPPINTDLKISF